MADKKPKKGWKEHFVTLPAVNIVLMCCNQHYCSDCGKSLSQVNEAESQGSQFFHMFAYKCTNKDCPKSEPGEVTVIY